MVRDVLIADDHPIFRRGLRALIDECIDFRLVFEAEDGVQALEKIRAIKPHIAVLDIGMPGLTGLDILAKAIHWIERPIFVLLTMYDDESYLHHAMEFGALGYLLKDNAEFELLECLRKVSSGQHYISPAVSGKLVRPADTKKDIREKLTPTERKILLMIGEYKTSVEIANLLSVSVRTIQNHRANICKKLGLRGPNALIKLANQLH